MLNFFSTLLKFFPKLSFIGRSAWLITIQVYNFPKVFNGFKIQGTFVASRSFQHLLETCIPSTIMFPLLYLMALRKLLVLKHHPRLFSFESSDCRTLHNIFTQVIFISVSGFTKNNLLVRYLLYMALCDYTICMQVKYAFTLIIHVLIY